ncbi:MAG: amidohydrolase family protein, partial [Armatimonadota bacterium]|nr:amidohydrolase family protein [Armatimonadota bacterium]
MPHACSSDGLGRPVVRWHLREVCLRPGGAVQDVCLHCGRLEEVRPGAAGVEVEGEGCLLLPGMIDPHVHLRAPGMEAAEDWESGTRAAARGGVTALFDMPNNLPPITTAARLDEKRALARAGSRVEWGVYLGAAAAQTAEIARAHNVAAVKVYMGSSTGDLLLAEEEALEGVFRAAALAGLPVALHAEDEAIIGARALQLRGDEDVLVHGWVRPPEAAAVAVRRALALGERTGAALHFCHVSTSAELDLLRAARRAGQKLLVEATPHHLFLDERDLAALGNFGKVNPPLRAPEERDALWRALLDGTVDVIGTDHAPHTVEAKRRPYREAPSGMPGLETALPLLLTAVLEGRLSFDRLTALTSENAA